MPPSVSASESVPPRQRTVASPDGGTRSARANSPRAVQDAGSARSAGPGAQWLMPLVGGIAVSYYLSAVLHVVAYLLAAAIFYLLGARFLEDETWIHTPIRASLDDEEVRDDDPKFALTPEIDLGLEKQQSSVQQLSRQLQISDAGWIDTLEADALTALSSANADSNEGAAGNGFFFQMPSDGLAVTKGSFTAWAEPANPKPGENYLIIIEIRLPDDIKRYRVADLTGEVQGTDSYRQRIPYDSRVRSAAAASTDEGLTVITSSSVLDVSNNKVQLAIRVPGAQRLVKDTISIRSRRLREEQELVLVFGRSAPDDE